MPFASQYLICSGDHWKLSIFSTTNALMSASGLRGLWERRFAPPANTRAILDE